MAWRNIAKTKETLLPVIFHPGQMLIVFDTETTGLGPDAKIIQFSGIRFRVDEQLKFHMINQLDVYINPEQPLPPKIVEITGITDEILKHAEPESVMAPIIFSFLESAPYWAAYNSGFDLRMLSQVEDRTYLMLERSHTIDILEMARDWFQKPEVEDHKLGTIFSHLFSDENVQFHSAIEDVKAAAKVMEFLLPKYRDWEPGSIVTIGRIPHIVKASLFVNPRRGSQQRIRLTLSEGEEGDIYYDIVLKRWDCKRTPAATRIFKRLDMAAVEAAVLRKYSNYYQTYESMDQLAQSWMKFRREKARERKKA